MSQDLENRKLEAEVKKLEIELYRLERPFARPSTWVSGLAAVAGFATAIASMVNLDRQRTINEVEIQRSEVRLSELESKIAEADEKLNEKDRELNDSEDEAINLSKEVRSLETRIDLDSEYIKSLSEIDEKIDSIKEDAVAVQESGETDSALEIVRNLDFLGEEITEQIISAQEIPSIVYYEKPLDAGSVQDAITPGNLGFEFNYREIPGDTYKDRDIGTNAVHCGTGADLEKAREVAKKLLDEGVRIQEFGPPVPTWKTRNDNIIYILTVYDENYYNNKDELTKKEIDRLSCEY